MEKAFDSVIQGIYSPNLALCDFFPPLFKAQGSHQVTRLEDVDDIKMALMTELQRNLKESYQDCKMLW